MKALYGLVGMKHIPNAEALVASLPRGEPLRLIPEPTNKFDRNAVMVWARGEHVGYLKASQIKGLSARIIAKGEPWSEPAKVSYLDAAAPPGIVSNTYHPRTIGGVLCIDGGRWPLVEVEE